MLQILWQSGNYKKLDEICIQGIDYNVLKFGSTDTCQSIDLHCWNRGTCIAVLRYVFFCGFVSMISRKRNI